MVRSEKRSILLRLQHTTWELYRKFAEAREHFIGYAGIRLVTGLDADGMCPRPANAAISIFGTRSQLEADLMVRLS